ncbi:competence/damage-inducible protein A [Chitinasiproducens palmae]|uniref:Predicted nucleotide-utilizing enzyme n=1 Tax=Chitinasiproducens palmae TaxID=1770053 RepID=A0A1H2PM30_9BURK|nr:molybdopterin-binding protein [Chitinasiproducens palmae]SDV47593.1 Predicted nucleotide-utilizing enzyme [Chitinasiproducens palmae]
MAFGLIVIGDEILSGRRLDKHVPKVIELLGARGLSLAWAEYLGDEPERITATLQRTFAGPDVVFVTGGIGATPDDHTRQCAARALGLPIELHPEARERIGARIRAMGGPQDPTLPENVHRLRMGEFPQGAAIIPNSYNQIPGFALHNHYFVPGFPVMAWPMIEWVLDTHYADLHHANPHVERSMLVFGLMEAAITPLMEEIETAHPSVRAFSLPSVGDAERGGVYARRHIDLGVKGEPSAVQAAYAQLHAGVEKLGGEIVEI